MFFFCNFDTFIIDRKEAYLIRVKLFSLITQIEEAFNKSVDAFEKIRNYRKFKYK